MLSTLGKMGKVEGSKVRYDSGKYSYGNSYCGKAQSTFVVKNGVAAVKDLVTLDDAYDYAIAGVPILRNGNDVSWYNYCAKQGWLADTVRGTYHTFLGLKGDGKIYVMSWCSTAKNMVYGMQAYRKFKPMGFREVIKLDGGGSQYLRVNGKTKTSTLENRKINNIIVIGE